MSRSFDGGASFETPRVIADVTDVGIFDEVRSISFDGIAGARTGSFPSLDIANGAPTGAGAPRHAGGRLVGRRRRAQPRARAGPALDDRRPDLERPGRGGASRVTDPTSPSSGISPNGEDVYVVYDGFLRPVPQQHD